MSVPSFEESSSRLARRTRPKSTVFDVPSARQALPLVQRILADHVAARGRCAHLEKSTRQTGTSGEDWSVKRQALERQDALEESLRIRDALLDELQALNVDLLDVPGVAVGFPTIVNGALAYLIAQLEDDDIYSWCYRDQLKPRPVPQSWFGSAARQPDESEGLAI